MITHDYTFIYKERLDGGRYPKRERKARNKAFVQGLPSDFPNDLKKWMAKHYIDIEMVKNPVSMKFGKPVNISREITSIPIRVVNHIKGMTEKLLIQTPIMKTPFGIQVNNINNDFIPPRYDIDLNFDLDNRNHQILFDNMIHIEKRVRKYCKENSRHMFRRKKIENIMVNEMFCSHIKQSQNANGNKYPPRLQLRLNERTRFFDENGRKINSDMDEIRVSPRDSVQAILELRNVWSMHSQFGISMVARQIRVIKSVKNRIQEQYAFADSSEED